MAPEHRTRADLPQARDGWPRYRHRRCWSALRPFFRAKQGGTAGMIPAYNADVSGSQAPRNSGVPLESYAYLPLRDEQSVRRVIAQIEKTRLQIVKVKFDPFLQRGEKPHTDND